MSALGSARSPHLAERKGVIVGCSRLILCEHGENAWLARNVAPSTTNPADTVISLGSAETITLHNVLATNVNTSDYIVHA